jgi:hypothetical protein
VPLLFSFDPFDPFSWGRNLVGFGEGLRARKIASEIS